MDARLDRIAKGDETGDGGTGAASASDVVNVEGANYSGAPSDTDGAGTSGDRTAVTGAARARVVSAIELGAVLADRYQIEKQLGEGGSGTVFRAWDRMLGELVAVKILHPQRARERSWIKRLAREVKVARAIRHPNVCRVFELGHAQGHWFVTMELATGGSLRDMLGPARTVAVVSAPASASAHAGDRPPPRPLADRLNDVRQLCAGLGAIHAVGITHRDVTPQNVLRMADGRLILTDFGLAIEHGDQTTVHGGTPAYMPPEATRGERSDQRSDVFQLGMIIHELLTGLRPAWAADGKRLVLVEPASGATATEEELTRVIEACVDPDPARRPSSALAVAGRVAAAETVRRAWLPARLVSRGRRFWRRHTRLLKVAVAATGVAVLVRGVQLASRPPLCHGAAQQMAGIWDDARTEAVRRAFAATRKDYAADAFARVRATLDDFAGGWRRMYTDACEATNLRGEQSSEVLDLRMSCLKESAGELRALTDLFSSADGEVVARAISAAAGLAPVARCADVAVLRAVVPPPADPMTRAKVETLRQRISEIKALDGAGRYLEGTRQAGPLLTEARALGYEPLVAEALWIEGHVERWTRPAPEADAALDEAMLRAEASRDDRVLAEAAVDRLGLFKLAGRADELERFVPRAEATLKRIGGDERLQSWIDTAAAGGLEKQNRYVEALAMTQKALAIKRRLGGDEDWDVALSLGNIAFELHALGRDREALSENQRAIAILERALGVRHPDLALHLCNRGEIWLALGQPGPARADYERALSIWQGELPPDHEYVGVALQGVGIARLAEGSDVGAAIEPLERALAIADRVNAAPEQRADTSFALARALWATGGDRARAVGLAARARALYPADRAGARARVDAALAAWSPPRAAPRPAGHHAPRR